MGGEDAESTIRKITGYRRVSFFRQFFRWAKWTITTFFWHMFVQVYIYRFSYCCLELLQIPFVIDPIYHSKSIVSKFHSNAKKKIIPPPSLCFVNLITLNLSKFFLKSIGTMNTFIFKGIFKIKTCIVLY